MQLIRETIRESRKRLIVEMKKAKEAGDEQTEEALSGELSTLDREENKIMVLLG